MEQDRGNKDHRTIDAISRNFQVDHPDRSIPALVGLYKEISKLPQGYWRTQKLKELQEVIAAASGLWMEAYGNKCLLPFRVIR
jgi:hypothetical protein